MADPTKTITILPKGNISVPSGGGFTMNIMQFGLKIANFLSDIAVIKSGLEKIGFMSDHTVKDEVNHLESQGKNDQAKLISPPKRKETELGRDSRIAVKKFHTSTREELKIDKDSYRALSKLICFIMTAGPAGAEVECDEFNSKMSAEMRFAGMFGASIASQVQAPHVSWALEIERLFAAYGPSGANLSNNSLPTNANGSQNMTAMGLPVIPQAVV